MIVQAESGFKENEIVWTRKRVPMNQGSRWIA
jgi:hypothetical protein